MKAYGNPGEGVEEYYSFEDGASKVFVVVADWGSGAVRDGVSIYAFDSLTKDWRPVALWDTRARGVKVEFDKNVGTVRVASKQGVLIFTINIRALTAKTTYDW